MNAIEKTIAIIAAMVILCSTQLSAQEFVDFQSSETGICVTIPSDMEIVKHDETILHLQSDQVVFSVHPLLTENMTSDDAVQLMAKTAAAAGLDLTEMDSDEMHNKTMTGLVYGGTPEKDVVLIVGIFEPEANDKICFLITLTYPDGAGDKAAGVILNTLEFNADVIQ